MARTPDVLKQLQRTDRHTLGGGNRLIWAPPMPHFTASPGLWDEAHYFGYPVKPLFTWTLLDGGGREIALRAGSGRWDPSAFSRAYAGETSQGKLSVRETLSLLPSDVVSCTLELKYTGRGKTAIHIVAWTALEQETAEPGDTTFHAGTLRFTRRAAAPEPFTFAGAFTLSPKPHSHAVALSEGPLPPPAWALTPFAEKFSSGRLPEAALPPRSSNSGTLFMALHEELQLQAGAETHAAVALALAPERAEAEGALQRALGDAPPPEASAAHWREHFAGVPRFACSDDQIQRYYWYRWYGLRVNTIGAGGKQYSRPVICEGPAGRRAPFAASAPGQMLENRWRHDPVPAQSVLLGFLDHQRADGSLPSTIEPVGGAPGTFTHADWGTAILQLDAVHHSVPFLRQIHERLVRYAKYLDGARDPEGSGLYDVLNHAETGMEYMHRYTALSEDADSPHEGAGFRLKGVDATVYAYTLKRALAVITRDLGKPGEAEIWEIEADKIRNAVRTRMWSAAEEMFFDLDAGTSTQTMVKAVSCFFPYTTDIVSAEHMGGLTRHLFDAREFWTPFPVPSTPPGDETFCAEPEWRGRRVGRPWNGRVWPPANSQIAEAIARSAIASGDASLRRRSAEFIRAFIRMMFFDGDPARPNGFEHYHPLNGAPSLYRGIDDCQHAFLADLIIRYVCGIRPTRDALVIDPFPFGLVSASIEEVHVRGRRVAVEIARKKFTTWIDGRVAGRSTIGVPVAFALP
ncbi:MAG TPA: trehalase family glycosidase [Bacteroidota bacterium]|nr:trehalase family glycosidase [Bacteroidota bacterium]